MQKESIDENITSKKSMDHKSNSEDNKENLKWFNLFSNQNYKNQKSKIIHVINPVYSGKKNN